MNDSRERYTIVLGLAEMFRTPLSEAAVEMYVAALSDLSLEDLRRAASECIRSCDFFPPPAKMLAAVGRGTQSVADVAIRAWAVVWPAVSEEGSYVSVFIADPVAARVVQAMGGWPTFCQPTQDLEWHRKEFIETYRAMIHDVGDDSPRRLPGIHEKSGGRFETVIIGTLTGEQRKLLTTTERTDAAVMGEITKRAGALVPTRKGGA